MLIPRGRRLFVFRGTSPTVFDPEHYPLAADKDVKCDPLVRRLSREIEELRAQLPVRRQCSLCGASRNTECFSQDEDVCDKCKLASLAEKPSEERRDQALRKLNSLPAFQESLLITSTCPDSEEPMGMNVDIHYGLHREITDALIKAGCHDLVLLDKILEKFGTVFGTYYVILNNEHNDANPFYEIGDALEAAFDTTADGRFFSVILEHTKRGVSYADASTVCEELGIEWPEEPDRS